MSDLLSQKHCVPCEGGVKPFFEKAVNQYLQQLDSWETDDYRKIFKEFKFQSFKDSINFINKVADIAEAEKHHPDIHIFYNKVMLELWTHAIGGLSENDFIMAAKIDNILATSH